MNGVRIGTKGELLLRDGETIVSVRYTAREESTNGVEFTTSKGTTFGPFGWISGNGTVIRVRLTIHAFVQTLRIVLKFMRNQ